MRPWVFAFSVLLSLPVWAATVEGTIREKGTRAPVPAAYIYVVELGLDALSDENGGFYLQLPDEPPAAVTLEIDSPGYARIAELVALPAGKSVKLDLFLTPNDVGTTHVRERRSPADRARGMHRIAEREVNELPGTYGDPAKAIENFPGMGRVKRSQGSLFIRGARPGETAVYVDDFEVPDLYHFTGSTSVINIPFVESVELVPGAFSARFGRATGGLVQLKTRKLPTDDVHGFAKFDVIDGGAYIGVPLSERAAVGMSARRSYLDLMREGQRALNGTGDDILLIPTYWDYQLKLDWDVTDGHELVVFGFGSGDRQLYVRDGAGEEPPYLETRESDFSRLAMRYRHLLGGGFEHIITPVIGVESRRLDVQTGLQYRERTTFDAQLRDELRWRADDARVVVGIDTTVRTDLFSFGGELAPQSVRELPSADIDGLVKARRTDAQTYRGTGALFAEGAWEPLEGLVLTPGVRLDLYWYGEEPQLSIEPRAAGSYAVTDGPWGLTLKGGGGVFGRPPDVDDVVAAQLAGRELPFSQALHLQGGMEQGLANLGTLSTTIFTVVRDHQPVRGERFPVPDDPLASPVARSGAGTSIGAEVLLRLARTGDWFGWLSYSVARHQLLDGPGPGAVTYAYLSEFDTTHLLALVGQYELGWGVRIGARYRVATGMPERPVIGSIVDADSGAYLPLYGPKAARRFDVFHSLDLRVDWSLLLPWLEADFYADLVNFHSALSTIPGLDFLNAVEDRRYGFDYASSTAINGLPLIPSVGVKVTF